MRKPTPIRSFVALTTLLAAAGCAADATHADEPAVGAAESALWIPPPVVFAWTPTPQVARRLRLLSGLPATAQTLVNAASSTFLNKGPTFTYGVVLDDGLFYSQGFASSNLAAATLNDPDADTVYRLGSQNKVLTAAGLAHAIEQHPSVSIGDLASKYV